MASTQEPLRRENNNDSNENVRIIIMRIIMRIKNAFSINFIDDLEYTV